MIRKKVYKDIDSYIESFPENAQEYLQKMRLTIKDIVPEAKEKISYGVPTFTLGRNLIHFGAFKNHIGFYPGALAVSTFQKELSLYKWAKGSIQFPFDKPLPLDLIKKIVKFRVAQELNIKKNK